MRKLSASVQKNPKTPRPKPSEQRRAELALALREAVQAEVRWGNREDLQAEILRRWLTLVDML